MYWLSAGSGFWQNWNWNASNILNSGGELSRAETCILFFLNLIMFHLFTFTVFKSYKADEIQDFRMEDSLGQISTKITCGCNLPEAGSYRSTSRPCLAPEIQPRETGRCCCRPSLRCSRQPASSGQRERITTAERQLRMIKVISV